MQPFTRVSGRAAPFPASNVDTDVIMPKTFLKGVDRTGLDVGVFNLLRFRNDQPDPDFILNRPGFASARFLVVGPNFGCGSSREHAVWGLIQLGFRALIGTSFAGIFNDNCRNNGMLTVTLDPETIAHIQAIVTEPGSNAMTVDLEAQTVSLDVIGETIGFDIDALGKIALLRGLNAVGLTLDAADSIRSFEAGYYATNPWLR